MTIIESGIPEKLVVGLYFEDFVPGAVFVSPGRTITEADVVAFCGVSGDYIELHTNEEYARRSPYGRRIAHGALIFSVTTGFTSQMRLFNDTVIALYGVDQLRFTKPVFIGDTVRTQRRIVEAQEKDPSRGVLTSEITVLNQNDETVMVYLERALVKRRP